MNKITGLFALAAFVAAFQAQARTPASAKASTGSTASYATTDSGVDRKNVISPTLGWMAEGWNQLTDGDTKSANMRMSGLFAIGFEYEYMLKDDFSIGGFMRYYDTSDSVGGTKLEDQAFLVGPMVHAYLVNTSSWIGYFGAGLTALSVKQTQSPSGGSSSSISPNVGLGIPIVMGVMYKFSPMLSGGIEHMQVMGLGTDINGWPISDIMLRLRIALAN